MRAYGRLWVFMGVGECQWESMGVYGSLWVNMISEYVWVSMGVYGVYGRL